MTLHKTFLRLWIGGLVLFAVVIALGLPLNIDAVPGGILDHQAAGTAEEAERIQRAWTAAGLYDQARIAMIGDLIFIGVYGLGSLCGGLSFRNSELAALRTLGSIVVLAAIVFLVTDYVETIAQYLQLSFRSGDGFLAGLAATVRPIKVVAWLVTFFGVITGLVVRRISSRPA